MHSKYRHLMGIIPQSYAARTGDFFQLQKFRRLTRSSITASAASTNFMKAWQLIEYDSVDSIHATDSFVIPKDLGAHEVLINVHAASVNPIDVEMCKGYGRTLINSIRKIQHVNEFPLILGRDCSGVIVRKGKMVHRLQEGDEVWCAKWIAGQGTHAEYVVATQNETTLKPARLSHIEAASLPFVASTVWAALVTRAGLNEKSGKDKKVFILGGSGGIGTFAVQLAKSFGAEVITTSSTENSGLCIALGADMVLDYNDNEFEEAISNLGPLDVILDARKPAAQKQTDMFQRHSETVHVSLMPPLLPSVDKNGVISGLFSSGASFISTNMKKMLCGKGTNTWGLFFPNSGILDVVKDLVDDNKIMPVLGKIVEFDEAKEAYQFVEKGHTRGKVVIKF